MSHTERPPVVDWTCDWCGLRKVTRGVESYENPPGWGDLSVTWDKCQTGARTFTFKNRGLEVCPKCIKEIVCRLASHQPEDKP